MQPSKLEIASYLSAAVVLSLFCCGRGVSDTRLLYALIGPLLLAAPLIFAFSFSRYLHLLPSEKHARVVLGLQAACITLAAIAFPYVTVPATQNPMQDEPSSATMRTILLVTTLALPVLLALALCLLGKRRSSLGLWASFLLSPYLFLFAVVSSGRWFEETPFTAILYFLPFVAAVLFSFSAGAVSQRPFLARIVVTLAALVSLPWLYIAETRSWPLVNSWIVFNLPDKERFGQPVWPAAIHILTVAIVLFSFALALVRLLPVGWRIGSSQVRYWTWPAFALTLAVLAFWFVEATSPYRIPGAVDYMDYPTFQILHIEKDGLQIHEKCLSVYQRRDGTRAYFGGENRRLFQYRFGTNSTAVPVSRDLDSRIRAWADAAGQVGWDPNARKPLRSWTAEGWYVSASDFGFQSYTTENGRTVPSEIPAIFHAFEQVAPSGPSSGQLADVCLGFCFDPPAAMGRLFSNHRCFNDGRTTTCR